MRTMASSTTLKVPDAHVRPVLRLTCGSADPLIERTLVFLLDSSATVRSVPFPGRRRQSHRLK